MSKLNATAQATGEAVLAASSGSDEAIEDPLRQRVIRLVLQLSDTPKNRLTMLKAHGAIASLGIGIEGHGVLKREEISIVSMSVPAPRPNEKLSDGSGL